MLTVKQLSNISGLSVRAIHHYDEIGLLIPTTRTKSGYRLYDHSVLERLQLIMLFKELEFPLSDIKTMLDNPNFNRKAAMLQQIKLLELKREHIDNVISLAKKTLNSGGLTMKDFEAFDTSKLDSYKAEAKKKWGETEAYMEYEEKTKTDTASIEKAKADGLMDIFARLGKLRGSEASSREVQGFVTELKDYITANYYTCTNNILLSLADMYTFGEMQENIDSVGGQGTAELMAEAIRQHIFS